MFKFKQILLNFVCIYWRVKSYKCLKIATVVDISVNVEKREKRTVLDVSNSFPILGQQYNGDLQHSAAFPIHTPRDGK